MPRLASFLILALMLWLAIRWLSRYSTQNDTGNAGGSDGVGMFAWSKLRDSTHTAYRRRYRELATALDALGQDIQEPTTRVVALTQAPVTEARTEAKG